MPVSEVELVPWVIYGDDGGVSGVAGDGFIVIVGAVLVVRIKVMGDAFIMVGNGFIVMVGE